MIENVEKFLNRTKEITLADLENGHDKNYLFRNTVEEFGEFAAARTVEEGVKRKVLKESARQEAVDLVICAFSLVAANNLDNREIISVASHCLKNEYHRKLVFDNSLKELLNLIQFISEEEVKNFSKDALFNQMQWMMGAYAVEKQDYHAIACFVISLMIYYSEGGDNEFLASYGMFKLDKWASRVTPTAVVADAVVQNG